MISSDVKIVSSSSKGNAVIILDKILVDCGVAYKALRPYSDNLRLVLLTHIHSDHFCKRTIKRLAELRPTLRWGCCEWLVRPLVECGVSRYQIDMYQLDRPVEYSSERLRVEAFGLYHNVENCGYKIHMPAAKILYATDTSRIDTQPPNYDLYLVEANYDEDDLQKRIELKKEAGAEYINELVVPENHLSRTAATEFILKNAGPRSEHIFMHVHEEREAVSYEK